MRKKTKPKSLTCELCKEKYIGKPVNFKKDGKKTGVKMILCPTCAKVIK